MTRALMCVVLMIVPRIAAAQEPRRQPLQELFLSEVVYPQERGEFQVTFGSLMDRTRDDRSALTPVSVEYGLTDRWQIGAAWEGYSRFHSSPFTHLRTARGSVGTKYSWMNIAHSSIHFAVGGDLEFPRETAFDEGEGEDNIEFEPFVAMAADLGRGLTAFGSVGLSLERSDVVNIAHGERPDDRGSASVGAILAFRRLTVGAEFTPRTDALPWRLSEGPLLTPELVVHPGRNWELAVGAPIGLRGGRQPGLALHILKEF